MERLLHLGQALPEAGGHGADARHAREHHGREPVPLNLGKDIICRGIERDVTEVDHRNVSSLPQLGLDGGRRRAVAFRPDGSVMRHRESERQNGFSGQIDRAARDVEREHLAGRRLRRGDDGRVLQNADGLERQQLRVAGPDGDGIEGSGLFAHLAPPGTNSKESKQGSYFPGSMR